MPRPPLLLGVDVGGTTMAAGVVTPQGEVVLEERVPTYRDGPGTASRRSIDADREDARGGRAVRADAISGIGIGVPARSTSDAGRIGDPVIHVPELAGRPLAAELGRASALPVFVDNDVNALALGEWMFEPAGAAARSSMLALGTGIGGGIVLDGRLIRGAVGFGGELGHVPVNFDGPPCFCGGRGCLSVYASRRGIVEAAQARVAGHPDAPLLKAAGGDPQAITTPLVFRAAAEGDADRRLDRGRRVPGAGRYDRDDRERPESGGHRRHRRGWRESLAPLEARILDAASEYTLRAARSPPRAHDRAGRQASRRARRRRAGALRTAQGETSR